MTLTVSDRSVTFADGVTYKTAPVVICGPMPTGEAFHVHAAECGDLRRKRIYRSLGNDIETAYEVRSLKDVVETCYGPEAGSFYEESGFAADDPNAWRHYAGDFRLFPCIELPEEEPIRA